MKAGIEWCAAFVIPSFVWSWYFSTHPPTYEQDWVMCCSLWFPFFTFRVFSTVLPNFYLWKQGLSDVLLFVIPFFVFGLKSIFSTVLPNFYLWKQGLSDVLLFCDSFLLCLVLRVFSTVLPISTHESRIEWCAALCDFLVFGLKSVFSTVLPISTYESRSDVLLFVIFCVWS
jgi:hypothetical protein